jgi:transposase
MTTATSVPVGPSIFVGIDTSKEKLDLARSDSNELLSVGNDAAGFEKIIRSLAELPVALIVVEATGGLERALVDALLEAALPVALVNPAQVRFFAKGLGILAKTDRIDATVLVQYARLAAPRLAEKRSKNQSELQALITCRRQLLASKTEQGNRKAATSSKSAIKAIDAVLATLAEQIRSLDEQIARSINDDEGFKRLDRLLKSVPGVGSIVSATLLAELRELGTTDRGEIAALVGVAPFNRDSGRFKGKRAIRGGRTSVRCVLYMAAVTAIRCNPVIKRFAHRLARQGKAAKVIITAAMRKLLSLINAMVRDNLTWDQLNAVKNV